MDEQGIKDLAYRFYEEVISGHSVDAIDKLVSEDFVEHEPGFDAGPGREGLKEGFRQLLAAFPDLEAECHDVMVDGDKLCARATFRGTHQGDLQGIPATGKRVEFQVIDIVRVADGVGVEHWGATDMAGLLMQIGVLPPQG